MQRQITAAVVTVALVFIFTWIIPSHAVAVLLIAYSDDASAALKLRAAMALGEESV